MPLDQQKIFEVDVKFKDSDDKEKTDTLKVLSDTPEGASEKVLTWVKQVQEQLQEQYKDNFSPDTDHEVIATRFVDMVIV